MSENPILDVMANIDSAIQNAGENTLAYRILELREEQEAIQVELDKLETLMLEKMKQHQVKSIKTEYATFIRAERANVKVDQEKAKIFLDSAGLTEQFSKIDDTKLKKVYLNEPNATYDFFTVNKPTEYLTIKKG